MCPNHKLVQHRDRKRPWCNTCGHAADGELIGRPRTEEAQKMHRAMNATPEERVAFGQVLKANTPAPTLGDIYQELVGLTNKGVTVESIQWVLDNQVPGWSTRG